MVRHPGEYHWSSYQRNTQGKPMELITPHFLFQALAKTEATQQKRYTALFEHEIAYDALEEIRGSINKAWVLGDGRFQQQIEKNTGRRALPNARGSDRKPEQYRARKEDH